MHFGQLAALWVELAVTVDRLRSAGLNSLATANDNNRANGKVLGKWFFNQYRDDIVASESHQIFVASGEKEIAVTLDIVHVTGVNPGVIYPGLCVVSVVEVVRKCMSPRVSTAPTSPSS